MAILRPLSYIQKYTISVHAFQLSKPTSTVYLCASVKTLYCFDKFLMVLEHFWQRLYFKVSLTLAWVDIMRYILSCNFLKMDIFLMFFLVVYNTTFVIMLLCCISYC